MSYFSGIFLTLRKSRSAQMLNLMELISEFLSDIDDVYSVLFLNENASVAKVSRVLSGFT